MTKEVREVLMFNSKMQLDSWGLNWKTIQKIDLKKKYKFTIGWRTLYKLLNDENYKPPQKTQMQLLDFFKINYNYKPSIVNLSKPKEDA